MARTLDETALRARIRDLHGQIKELQAQLRQERDAFKAALVLRRYRRNAKPNEEDAARPIPWPRRRPQDARKRRPSRTTGGTVQASSGHRTRRRDQNVLTGAGFASRRIAADTNSAM